jgi:glycosyltransferase involved in cell wall biosynthesis
MHLKEDIVSRGISSDRVCLMPNGVDTEKFKPIQKNDQLIKKYGMENKICVGFIGTFFRFEGLELLIDAILAVIKSKHDIKFLLIGDGERMGEIKKKVNDFGLNDIVILTGKVPHDQIMEYYSIMDILVYPRISERITELVTPLKTLEAMSMAKAVAGSDVGGIKEIIEDNKNGLLFKAGNADDLAVKILYLAGDPHVRTKLGRQAREDMQKKREWSGIIRRYIDLYTELLSNRN